MQILKWTAIILLALIVSAIAAGQLGWLKGKAPADLGVKQGKLKGLCPTPNCVSSQAGLYPDHPQRQYASIAPLALRGDGPATVAQLKAVVQNSSNANVISSTPEYVYAQFTTPLMKYVDDVEFWFDPKTNAIELRSASRLGRSDLGANRKRIETIRLALAATP